MEDLLIFLSYAHEDVQFKDDFIKEFKPAAANNNWTVWQDGEIKPGANWDDAIKENLSKARIVILFVSTDFLVSEYIDNVELKQALERQNDGSALVIPVILENCLWEDHKLLPKIQAINIYEKIADRNDKQQVKAALQYAAREVRDSVKAYQPAAFSKISGALKPEEIQALHQLNPGALILDIRQKQDVFMLLPNTQSASLHKLSADLPEKVLRILQRLLLKGDLEENDCQVLGEALFRRIFPDESSQKAFITAYQNLAAASKGDKPLKIVLHFDDASSELAGLPWEYLWLPLPEGGEEGFFIGEKENLVLTRRLSAAGGKEKKVEADQLRILVAYSKPLVQEIAERIEADAKSVFGRSQPKSEEGKKQWVNIKVIGSQEFKSKKAFEDFIGKEPLFHIVHFIGEGKTEGEKSLIAFCDAAAKKEDWLAPDDLVKCFPAGKKPNLLFLHAPPDSCRSLRDMALNLVSSVDGVLAIQTPVKSEEAADFSEKLYTALAHGKDLDEAVTQAARYVAGKSANRLRMYGLSASFSRATLKMEVAKPVAAPAADILLSYLSCPNWDKPGIECKEKIGLKEGGRPTRLYCDNEKCSAGPLWQCPNCNNLIILSKKLCPRCGYETAKIQLPDDVRHLLPEQQIAGTPAARAASPGSATDRAAHNPQESRRSEPGLPR